MLFCWNNKWGINGAIRVKTVQTFLSLVEGKTLISFRKKLSTAVYYKDLIWFVLIKISTLNPHFLIEVCVSHLTKSSEEKQSSKCQLPKFMGEIIICWVLGSKANMEQQSSEAAPPCLHLSHQILQDSAW